MKKMVFVVMIFSIFMLGCSNRAVDEELDRLGQETDEFVILEGEHRNNSIDIGLTINGEITEESDLSLQENDLSVSLEIDDDNGEVSMNGVNEVFPEEKDGKMFFRVYGEDFAFYANGLKNPDLVVNLGDSVRVEMKSNDEMYHDFMIDELGVRSNSVQGAAVTAISFEAEQRGVFKYYCGVDTHREMGMEGNFIVK